jgi:SAM-dependent methyltransferase
MNFEFLQDHTKLVFISFSAPHSSSQNILRLRIKPVMIKKGLHFQVEEFSKTQSFTQNITASELEHFVKEKAKGYGQIVARLCDSEQHLTLFPDGKVKTKTKQIEAIIDLEHNRRKAHRLPENEPLDFLIALGIQNKEGRVFREKYDKYKQINQYLLLLEPIFASFDTAKPLTIVDFACGKAYLTFALYHYLTAKRGFIVNLHGVDLKKAVLDECQALAKKLGYNGMQFHALSIEAFSLNCSPDLVVALHACNTATDVAIDKALAMKATAIAIAPCCQQELLHTLPKSDFGPFAKHGILKERYAALLTDALRAERLEESGYKTDVVEFVDPQHSPKNLLIRALFEQKSKNSPKE